MSTPATVYDIAPAQLRRMKEAEACEPQPDPAILADLADGVEAIHCLANLAKFSNRPRAFVLALASVAHTRDRAEVELCDKELAALQNCSVKTVQRQRAEYFEEVKRTKFDLVEIIEGDLVKTLDGDGSVIYKNNPTRYRFHIAGAVEKIITRARASSQWHQSDRRKQRNAIACAARVVFDEIPRGHSLTRAGRNPRLATAEIETCLKVAAAKLKRAQQIAGKLPTRTRAALLDEADPRQLRQKWLEMRAAMDAFFDAPSQMVEETRVDKGTGQVVQSMTGDEEAEAEANADDLVVWNRTFGHLSAPPVERRTVSLRPPPQTLPPKSASSDEFLVEPLESFRDDASSSR